MKVFKKDPFSTIRFKQGTADRFRNYSRKIAKTHTQALEALLDFFERNKVSPYEDLSPTVSGLEHLIKKRINGLVAILKNIEKHQTLPTQTMMQLLFEGNTPKEKKLLIERKSNINSDDLTGGNEHTNNNDSSDHKIVTMQNKIDLLQRKNDQLSSKNTSLISDLKIILDNSIPVKPPFGKAYFKLDISQSEYKKINIRITKN